MTDRISLRSSVAPTTDFILEADRVGQSVSGNYTTARIFLKAINRGNTGSFFNNYGQQVGSIDGIGGNTIHSGHPFLPSGYATGAQRWRDSQWDVNIPHNADGTRGAITLRMVVSYGSNYYEGTASFNDFPAINRVPGTPTNLGISSISHRSAILAWTRGAINGTFQYDQIQISSTPQSGAGDFVAPVEITTTVSGITYTIPETLMPGVLYYVHVRTRNQSNFSPWTTIATFRTLAGARVKVNGVWKQAIPFVKVNGVWKKAIPFVKQSGTWRPTL